jgi:hypothetical protein
MHDRGVEADALDVTFDRELTAQEIERPFGVEGSYLA